MVLLNTLTANGKYPLHYRRVSNSKLKSNYVKNEKVFLDFLFDFLNLYQFLNILKEKLMVIANIFPNLQTVKIFVRPLSKKRCFRKCLVSKHVKVSRIFEEAT